MYRLIKLPEFICLLILLWLAPGTMIYVNAADLWINDGVGNWYTPTNWDDGSVPTSGDTVDMSYSIGTAQVKTPGAVADDLYIGLFSGLEITSGGTLSNTNSYTGPESTVNVDGVGSIWTNSGDLYVGWTGIGSLNITNGGMVNSANGNISFDVYNTGSNGSVTVDGTGSTWGNSSYLTVGWGGVGSLEITNGGAVSNTVGSIGSGTGSNGSVIVDGVGSTWTNSGDLTVGWRGVGSLGISNGGVVSNTVGYIGSQAGSEGSVTVDGTGSTWGNSSYLTVGLFGTGSLEITNGGAVSNTVGSSIGSGTGSNGSVIVDGVGSTWTNSGDLTVGWIGVGSLGISNGGVVSNTLGYIDGSNGSVTVDGVGSTWINSGTLTVGLFGTGSLNITNGGKVSNTDGIIGYDFDGSGSVTVDGVGSTWTNSGDLTVGWRGVGSLDITDGGMVNVNGAMSLAKLFYSTGTLNIGTGGVAGVLNTVSVDGGAGTATLNFNHSDGGYYFTNDGSNSGTDVLITGTTAVNHIGGGTTFLTGAHTYSGATAIDDGILYVNGSNSNSITTINTGGTLGGTGTVGSVIINGGTFAPGNSIGTTTVSGDVDFSGGGIYQVEVNDAGNSDLIDATGSATLTGGSVEVQPEAGTYQFTTNYTILTAAGGVNGTFDSVISSEGTLTPILSYDANNVLLALYRNDVSFGAVAVTPNQVAASNALTELAASDPVAVADLMNALLLLSDEEAQQAFDSLSGVQHSINLGLSNNMMLSFFQLIRAYRGSQSWGNQLAAFDPAHGANGLNSGDALDGDRHWWIKGFSGDGDIGRDGTIAGMDYRSNGLAFGADMPYGENWTLGLAGSFANSDINGGGSDADVSSYQVAAYANWQQDNWFVDSALGYGRHDTDNDRLVTVGLLSGIASAGYDSDTFAASVEVGKRISLNNGVNLVPYAGLEYSKTDREGFTETGSPAPLTVSSEDHESIRSKFGIQLSKIFKTGKGTEYVPSVYAAYVHEHGDKDNLMKAAFSAAPATTFSIEGNDIDRDRLQLGFGLTANINNTTQFDIGYDGEFAGSDDHHSLSAGLRVRW